MVGCESAGGRFGGYGFTRIALQNNKGTTGVPSICSNPTLSLKL